MPEQSRLARFEESVLPHMDAAYNLARWLTRNDLGAEDLVQDAYLRAFRLFDSYRGGNSRAWVLKIVRNTFYSSLQREAHEPAALPDEELAGVECEDCDPESAALARADVESLRKALDRLPVEYREALVLRELEGFSYKEIAVISGIPLGTVMSRLARGRRLLQALLTGLKSMEAPVEL